MMQTRDYPTLAMQAAPLSSMCCFAMQGDIQGLIGTPAGFH